MSTSYTMAKVCDEFYVLKRHFVYTRFQVFCTLYLLVFKNNNFNDYLTSLIDF